MSRCAICQDAWFLRQWRQLGLPNLLLIFISCFTLKENPVSNSLETSVSLSRSCKRKRMEPAQMQSHQQPCSRVVSAQTHVSRSPWVQPAYTFYDRGRHYSRRGDITITLATREPVSRHTQVGIAKLYVLCQTWLCTLVLSSHDVAFQRLCSPTMGHIICVHLDHEFTWVTTDEGSTVKIISIYHNSCSCISYINSFHSNLTVIGLHCIYYYCV